jgi:hypothetical protein
MPATWTATLWEDDVTLFEHGLMAFARLVWQYRGNQPRLQNWLASFMTQMDSIEGVSMDVLVGRWPLTAIGAQLDTLGDIVGQERGGMTDAQYRLFILARILVNRGNGRIEEINDILAILGAPTINSVEFFPAELRFSIAGIDDGDLIGDLIGEAKGGGVTLRWVWSEYLETATFQFADVLGADDTDATTGFGDLTEATQTTGGYLSGGTVY